MILEHYNLTPPITQFDLPNSGINNTTVGIRTGDGDFVFKHFDVPHGIEGLEYEQNLLTWLAKQSLSFGVPALIPTTLGQTYYQNADGYHALMPLPIRDHFLHFCYLFSKFFLPTKHKGDLMVQLFCFRYHFSKKVAKVLKSIKFNSSLLVSSFHT